MYTTYLLIQKCEELQEARVWLPHKSFYTGNVENRRSIVLLKMVLLLSAHLLRLQRFLLLPAPELSSKEYHIRAI